MKTTQRLIAAWMLAAIQAGCAPPSSAVSAPPASTLAPPNTSVAVDLTPRPAEPASEAAGPANEAPASAGPDASAMPAARPGPCPAPSAAATSLFTRASALAESTDAIEPHHAITEAIRMRLDELYQSGCRASLRDDQLVEEVRRLGGPIGDPPKLFGDSLGPLTVMIGHHTSNGSGVGMYTFTQGKVRTRIDVTDEGREMERRLLLLAAEMWRPPGSPEAVLVLTNTHPWMASCWRSLRFRVLAPSGDPLKPTALLDRPGSGRWCEETTIETEADEVRFRYDGWTGALRTGEIVRSHVLSFRYEGPQPLRERFGFADGFPQLVEDWIEKPWALASEATIEGGRSRLESLHDKISAFAAKAEQARSQPDGPELTQELFPGSDATKRRLVVYCALSSSEKPCAEWPKPVDFFLEQKSGRWLVSDVKPRP